MTFLAGLIWGILIAAATVGLEHYGPSIGPLHMSLSGNGAIAAPVVLVPLAIFWGWSGAALCRSPSTPWPCSSVSA